MYRATADKPLRIIRHASCNEPGYLCQALDKRGVDYGMVCVEEDQTALRDLDAIAGLILLGAPVSVYDPLPWIADELDLIREAAEQHIPMLGICFGAQLLSHALGGEVTPAANMQVGWHPVHTLESARSESCLTELPSRFEGFEWHGDTFSLPPGATPLFRGGCIANQGFIRDNALAVQFHPEVTGAQIKAWLTDYQHCLPQPSGCVQSPEEITRALDERLQRQRAVTDRLLTWWLSRVDDRPPEHSRRYG